MSARQTAAKPTGEPCAKPRSDSAVYSAPRCSVSSAGGKEDDGNVTAHHSRKGRGFDPGRVIEYVTGPSLDEDGLK